MPVLIDCNFHFTTVNIFDNVVLLLQNRSRFDIEIPYTANYRLFSENLRKVRFMEAWIALLPLKKYGRF